MSHCLARGGHLPGSTPSVILPNGGSCSGGAYGVIQPPSGPPATEGAIQVPQTADAWVALGLPAPDALWLCQETSGNLAAAVGGVDLVAGGSGHVYAQAVSGWTRTFVGLTDGVDGRWHDSSAALLNLASGQSAAWLGYFVVTNAAANRRVMEWGGPTSLAMIRSDGTARVQNAGSGSNGAVNHRSATAVRPWVIYRNATTNVSGLRTSLEAITCGHSEGAVSNVSRGLGPSSTDLAPTLLCGLLAFWKGAGAETIALASTLTTLGW